MTEKLLKKMIEIVDATVVDTGRSDFYKYDLHLINSDVKPKSFFWGVGKYGTRIGIVDVKNLESSLKCEIFRFIFMREKIGFVFPAIMYSFDNNEPVYFYDSDCDSLELVTKEWFYGYALNYIAPFVRMIEEKYQNEQEYYFKKVPIKFTSKEQFGRFLNIARTDEGKQLIEQVKFFRNYGRRAIDHYIQIGYEYGDKDFSFAEMVNGACRLNGGIIYYNGKWSRHT